MGLSSLALLNFLGEDLINHSVLQGFTGSHPIIPVCIGENFFIRLAGMLRDDLIELPAGFLDLLRSNHNVGSLALRSS